MTITYNPSLLQNLNNPTTAVTTINNNETAVSSAFQQALSISGDSMLGTLNMNGQQIVNLPAPSNLNSPARLQDVTATTVNSVLAANITGVSALSVIGNSASFSQNAQALPLTGTGNIVSATFPALTGPTITGNIILTSQSSTGSFQALGYVGSAPGFIWGTPATIGSSGQYLISGGSSGTSSLWVSFQSTPGTLTGAAASTGTIGEVATVSGVATGLTNGAFKTIATIVLQPGDWDISGSATFTFVNTVAGGAFLGLSSVSAPSLVNPSNDAVLAQEWAGMTVNGQNNLCIGPGQIIITAASTYFLIAEAGFNTSCTVTGRIRARRMR